MCTSLHLLLFDNAGTRQRLGVHAVLRCPVQQMTCNHTDLPVGLVGRPVSGQATIIGVARIFSGVHFLPQKVDDLSLVVVLNTQAKTANLQDWYSEAHVLT